jgi:hypothetical protein
MMTHGSVLRNAIASGNIAGGPSNFTEIFLAKDGRANLPALCCP